MTEPYESPLTGPLQRQPRYEVCRGPVMGRWTFHAFVPDLFMAERILAHWRRKRPDDVHAIFCDGCLHEDAERRRRREERERLLREARYFEGLAVEAQREGEAEAGGLLPRVRGRVHGGATSVAVMGTSLLSLIPRTEKHGELGRCQVLNTHVEPTSQTRAAAVLATAVLPPACSMCRLCLRWTEGDDLPE